MTRKEDPSGGQKETRERVLDSAESVFAEAGFGGARIKEISRRAGVTSAMVHYYFQTKEELYRAVLDRMVADLVHLVSTIAPAPIDPVPKLKRFFYGFFDYAARHRNFARLTSMEMGHDNIEYALELFARHFKPLYALAKGFLQKGIKQGAFQPIDPDHLLSAIYGMTISYFSDSPFIEVLSGRKVGSQATVAQRRDLLMAMILRIVLRDPEQAVSP